MAKTEDELRADFERWARRADGSAWLIVLALIVEAGVVWIFSDHKALSEVISLIAVDLAIALGVYGEIHFANRGKEAAAQLQRISDEKVAEAKTRASAEALSKISPVLLGENSPLKRQCLKVPRGTCVERLQGMFCERGVATPLMLGATLASRSLR